MRCKNYVIFVSQAHALALSIALHCNSKVQRAKRIELLESKVAVTVQVSVREVEMQPADRYAMLDNSYFDLVRY